MDRYVIGVKRSNGMYSLVARASKEISVKKSRRLLRNLIKTGEAPFVIDARRFDLADVKKLPEV